MNRRPEMKMFQLEDIKERKGDKERVRETEKERSRGRQTGRER
jgi:hypothetical protein